MYGETTVSDRRISRLPVSDRTAIKIAERSIDVAAENLEEARAARDDALRFRHIGESELAAAYSRLAEPGGEQGVARAQLRAARAKMDYANRLVELRQMQIDEADARLVAARSDVEMTKVKLLTRQNLASGLDTPRIAARNQRAQERLADSRARVARLQGEVSQLRTAWNDRPHAFETASRGAVRPAQAPAANPGEAP
jgi:hypothetical protein